MFPRNRGPLKSIENKQMEKYVAYVWAILWLRCPPFFMTFLLPWSRVWFVAPSQGVLVPMVLPNPPI